MARKAKDTAKALDPEAFYEEALSQAERINLRRARKVEGLDQEIALLRVRLMRLAQEYPQKFDLLIKGISLLVRAIATKYKLSPRAEQDFYQSVLGVVKGIGDALLPEELHDL